MHRIDNSFYRGNYFFDGRDARTLCIERTRSQISRSHRLLVVVVVVVVVRVDNRRAAGVGRERSCSTPPSSSSSSVTRARENAPKPHARTHAHTRTHTNADASINQARRVVDNNVPAIIDDDAFDARERVGAPDGRRATRDDADARAPRRWCGGDARGVL